jgi:hypothetical protein
MAEQSISTTEEPSMIQRVLSVLALLTVGVQVANAGPIDYKVNLAIGGGTVTGDIFTDGTIGALAQSNITNWVLTLNNGVDPPFTLLGPLSGNNSGRGFNLLLDIADPLNALPSGQLTWTFAQPPASDPSEELFINRADQQYKFVFYNSDVGSPFGPQLILNGPTFGISEPHASGTTVVLGVAALAPCTFTLSPTGQSFGAQGGSGSFIVTTFDSCTWAPSTDQPSWLTLDGVLQPLVCVGDVCSGGSRSQTGPGKVTYIVQPNPGIASRQAAVFIADQRFNIQQDGLLACKFVVSPTHIAVTGAGGAARIVVNALPGCFWNASSAISWIHVTAGADGFGSMAVQLQIDPNGGAARSSNVIVAGQTVTISQPDATNAGTCGSAVEIGQQVSIYRSGFTTVDLFGNLERQTITVTNTSGRTITGPVYLVFQGLPTSQVAVVQNPSLTTCFSPAGDTIVVMTVLNLAPGQVTGYLPLFSRQDWWDGIQYTPRILIGTPPLK